ncbi:MAG: hypothetical protein RLZZ08_395 [Pseudomonadota bacterium]|jgi:RimJ/RimL family protein N-acetyltransferase
MDRQPVLDGERLWLRPLRGRDWNGLWGIAQDRQIWAMHPAHDRWQEPVFRAFFDDALAQRGALVVVDKASGALIGSSRFQNHIPVAPDGTGGQVEIGWSFLDRPYWGLGYNAEFKQLMLAHALRHVERVVFSVGADNLISRRAMANIGGRLTGETHSTLRAGVMTEHVIFEITRDSFARGPLAR